LIANQEPPETPKWKKWLIVGVAFSIVASFVYFLYFKQDQYHNKQYNVNITFHKDWKLQDYLPQSSENIVAYARGPGRISNMYVLVTENDGKLAQLDTMNEAQIKDATALLLSRFTKDIASMFPDFKSSNDAQATVVTINGKRMIKMDSILGEDGGGKVMILAWAAVDKDKIICFTASYAEFDSSVRESIDNTASTLRIG
jgi:hypothetical protein